MATDDTARGAKTTPGHEPPLSIPEAAEFLNVTDRWVRRAVRERRIPYLKVGRHVRFLVEDLQAYLAQSRVEPTPAPAVLPGPYLRRLSPPVERRPAGPRRGAESGARPASA
jgi:excisionase family DNA binding protein